jgi:hypothetical protein
MATLRAKPNEARATRTIQVWVEAIADDPEALSAFEVARRTLPPALRPKALRRMRLIEIAGVTGTSEELRARLHQSTQFYNPHKERCHLREAVEEGTPAAEEERLVLIHERGAERRTAAERWWRHATGDAVRVREALVWLVTPEVEESGDALLAELVDVKDRRHGLLCNPNSQDRALGTGAVPLPWIRAARARAPRGHA